MSIPGEVIAVARAFEAWSDAPGAETLEALHGAVDGLQSAPEAGWRWEGPIAQGHEEVAAVGSLWAAVAGGRRLAVEPSTLLGWWDRGPALQARQRLMMAVASHPTAGFAALRTPFSLPDVEARRWLMLLGHAGAACPAVLDFVEVFLDTRPRALWMKAAEALARLQLREDAARRRAERIVAGGEGERHSARHVRYLQCSILRRASRAHPDEAVVLRSVRGALREGAADQSNALDGLRQLVRGPTCAGAALDLLRDAVLGDRPRLRADRQVEHGLRRLWEVLRSPVVPASERVRAQALAQEVRALLLEPRWRRAAGPNRVDAMWAWLETAAWWSGRGDVGAAEAMGARAEELGDAVRFATAATGAVPDADEALQERLKRLLDPVERQSRHVDRARVTAVEALALLRHVLGEGTQIRWTALLQRSDAPDPGWAEGAHEGSAAVHPRAGTALDIGGTTMCPAVARAWKDLTLRLFFAGVAPATLLRDEPLDERDLLRISRALRSAREGDAPDGLCAGLEVGALSRSVIEERESEMLRHVAVETERRLAVQGVAGHRDLPIARLREEAGAGPAFASARLPEPVERAALRALHGAQGRLRMLWQHMEYDPERAFFQQLHDCLRGSNTALHRFVRSLEHVDEARVVSDRDALRRLVEAFARAEDTMRAVLEDAVQEALSLAGGEGGLASDLCAHHEALHTFGRMREAFRRLAEPVLEADGGGAPMSPEEIRRGLDRLFLDGAVTPLVTGALPAIGAMGTGTLRLPGPELESGPRGGGRGGQRGAAVAWQRWLHPGAPPQEARAARALHTYGLAQREVAAANSALSGGQLRRLEEAEAGVLALSEDIIWPLRTLLAVAVRQLAGWRTRRAEEAIALRREEAVAARRAEREAIARRPLEAWTARIEQALTRGDEQALLAALGEAGATADEASRTGEGDPATPPGRDGVDGAKTPGDPEPVPRTLDHLPPELVQRVHAFLLQTMNVWEARRIRTAVGTRVSLPGEWEPFKPLLAGTLVGPVLILDVGEEWNGLLKDYAANWFPLAAIMLLSFVGSFVMIASTVRPGIPVDRGTLWSRTMQRLRRAVLPFAGAFVVAFGVSATFLMTLINTEIFFSDEPSLFDLFLQTSLWGFLSLFLSILIGVLLQGRRMSG